MSALYVALGDDGHCMTSPDGVTWTTQSVPNVQWSDVTYGVAQFVAVSSDNNIITSPDGVTWTEQTNPDVAFGLFAVTYGGGVYVAVGVRSGPAGGVMSSTDGVAWTLRTSVTAADVWIKVAYGNGVFCALGNQASGSGGNFLMTSADGVTWSGATINPAWASLWNGMDFGNGLFIAQGTNGGADIAMTSPDGVTWTLQSGASTPAVGPCYATAYGAGVFCAVESSGSNARNITSPDGVTWTGHAGAVVSTNWFDVVFGDVLFVAVGSHGKVQSSPDALTWTERTGLGDFGSWEAIAFRPDDGPTPPTPTPDPDYPPDHVPYPGRYAWASAAPYDGTTWLYDGSTGFWSMLKSAQISRHRVQFSFQCAGQTIGADYFNGKLYRITDTALSDNGKMIEGEIIGETLAMPDEAFLTVNKLRVGMEVGVGNTVAPGDNPQVALSIARDSGAKDFGPEMWKPLGRTGEVYARLEWRRLGTTRYFTAKLRITDPVKRVITSAAINPSD